jgi:peptidoglycan hydrolase-like protein with peptidoglycan-binding domain
MNQRFAFLTLLLLVSTAFVPFRILADSSTSLPSAAQALMQALTPPAPSAPVTLNANVIPPAASSTPASTVAGAIVQRTVTFTRPLIIGSHGSDVSALQNISQSQGYFTGNVTGYFGSLTALALKKFQTAHSIEAVAGVGPKTRTLLNSLTTPPTDKAALIASLLAQVRALQTQIAALLAAQSVTSTGTSTVATPIAAGGGGGGSPAAGTPATISNYTPPSSGGR